MQKPYLSPTYANRCQEYRRGASEIELTRTLGGRVSSRFHVTLNLPCIWLAHLKFELTNQDSEAWKGIEVRQVF